MNIIENIIHKLSKKENRKYFILIFFLLMLIILIPLNNTFNAPITNLFNNISWENIINTFKNPLPFINKHITYELTHILAYFQLLIVLITIIILYKKTSKSEINRYKENYNFYEDTYSNLKHHILKFPTVQSSSIDYSFQSSLDISNIGLSDIVFLLNDCEYNLPFLIEEQARNILIEKFNIQSKNDYNGLTLALNKIEANENKLEFTFCKSEYFKYLLTNMLPEYEILPNLTIRDLLESSNTKTLNTLENSLAENHLGISSLITINLDNNPYYIIPKRTENTTVFKGQLSPSVSGAANINTCQDLDNGISIKNFFKNEIEEELGDFITSISTSPLALASFITDFIEKTQLIGISRELKRLGKPELFFIYNSNISIFQQDLQENNNAPMGISLEKKENYYFELQLPNKTSEKNIDKNENEIFLLVPTEDVGKYLGYKKIKTKSASSYQEEEIYTEFFQKFKVSESLLVNLIYANKSRNCERTSPV